MEEKIKEINRKEDKLIKNRIMKFGDDDEFKNNPNLKFNSYILKYDKYPGKVAEIFYSFSKNKIYIISIENIILNIYETFDSSNITKILSLQKHKRKIEVVRYAKEPTKDSEYLLSADTNMIFIWDINNNFDNKYKIDYICPNKSKLIDSILFFSNDIINRDYIFATSSKQTPGMNCYNSDTKMYSLDNKYIKDLEIIDGYLYHLLIWNDNINHNYYIVILTILYIAIINILDGKLYWTVMNYTGDFDFNLNANKSDHAYIYKNNNNYYLVDLNYFYVTIWDLYKKCKVKQIKTDIEIFNKKLDKNEKIIYKLKRLVKWNNKYTIVIKKHHSYNPENEYSSLQIIDLEQGKVITKMGNEKDEKEYIRFMKPFIHPIYGESLIAVDKFKGIQLWTINN